MGRFSIPMKGFVLFCLWAVIAEAEYLKYKDPKQPMVTRIKDLMKRMTLEEKIGQMSQIERRFASTDVMKQYFIGMFLKIHSLCVYSAAGNSPMKSRSKVCVQSNLLILACGITLCIAAVVYIRN